eukprot:scaffold2044_cov305-Pavlova_lutheri.AAC.18
MSPMNNLEKRPCGSDLAPVPELSQQSLKLPPCVLALHLNASRASLVLRGLVHSISSLHASTSNQSSTGSFPVSNAFPPSASSSSVLPGFRRRHAQARSPPSATEHQPVATPCFARVFPLWPPVSLPRSLSCFLEDVKRRCRPRVPALECARGGARRTPSGLGFPHPPSLGPSDGAPPRKEKRARIDTSKKIAMKEGTRSQGGEGSWTHVSALADSDTDEGPPRQPLWGRRKFPPKYLDPRRGSTFTCTRSTGRGGSCDVRCLAILLSRGPCVVSFADPPIRRWKRKYLFANRGVFPPNRTNASRPRGGNEPRGCPLLQHHNERNANNSILSKSEVGKVVVNTPPKGSERDGMEDMDRLPSSWNVFAW